MLKLFVSMQTYVTGVLNRDRGATAVEYGLLVALIAAIIIATVVILGHQILNAFKSVTDGLTSGGVSSAS